MNREYIYELPYNHDLNFFESYYYTQDKLVEKDIDLNRLINFIYMPAYYKHSRNTREEAVTSIFMPRCKCEYQRHISLINNRLNLKIGVLFQEPNLVLSKDVIKWYEEMGVNVFIVNSDSLAYLIKEHNEQLTTVASVTKRLRYNDYFDNDLSMYDVSCLNFPFERGISAIQSLPRSLKYSMIINNSGCLFNCKWQQKHWYMGIKGCNSVRMKHDDSDLCIINPGDLKYFEPYIYSFKIQGREVNISNAFSTLRKYVLNETDDIHSWNYFDKASKDIISGIL